MNDLIIVIDDDPGIKQAFKKMLRHEKFLILTLSNSEDAIPLICTSKPQLILLDIKMPGSSGVELLKKIKQLDREIPVIIMTAYSNIFTEKEARRLGADAYLKKPFEINSMITISKQLISKFRAGKLGGLQAEEIKLVERL